MQAMTGRGEAVSVKNDPFMTHAGERSEQLPGSQRVNLRHDPMMIGGDASQRGGSQARGRNNEMPTSLQITVCYVTNLKNDDWGCGRRPRRYVVCELAGTQQRFKAHARTDKVIPPDVLKTGRHVFPTSFEHTGVFANITPGMLIKFRVQEDGMMGASDVCKPFAIEASHELFRMSWNRAVEEILNNNASPQGKDSRPNEMKVRIVAVKENRPPGNRLRAPLEDKGLVQDLTVLATLRAPAEQGQHELEADVPYELQRRLGLKKGDNVFIAPEVTGMREMVRMLSFVKKDNRNFIRLDSRLRHSHGVGTTVAMRSKDAGIGGAFGSGVAFCCLHCFEHVKICVHHGFHDSRQCCLSSFWGCCVCCIECSQLCSMARAWCCGRTSLVDLRRTCARRCNLPYDPQVADAGENDTGCCCIPLRMAVFMLSMLTFIIGVFDFFAPTAAEGIDVKSHVVSGVIELFGMPLGLIGMIGAWELDVNMLRMYNYFQMARLGAKLFMMYNDAPLLVDCDIWRTDINAAIKKYGWNKQMYDIAMENVCTSSLVGFVLVNTFLFWIYMYLISLTRKLVWACESTPNYLLAAPKMAPSGAFSVYPRSQGPAKPPYGAMDGTGDFGRRPGIVGAPVGVAFKPLQYNSSLASPRRPGNSSHFTY
jgi:hypothetical protein